MSSTPAPVRILFYPHTARALSSSLIGHLAELCREFRVVLLTPPLHPRYARLLEDRARFPLLERIEKMEAPGYSLRQLLRDNRRWQHEARRIVATFRPQVVVTENDMSGLFDMYLLREARRAGAACLTIQGMLQQPDFAIQRFIELLHTSSDAPGPARLALRLLVFRARKWLGHLLVHYLLPWSAGERALTGRSSYVLRTGASGLRDSDLNLVPCHQAFRAHMQSGVPAAKLALLAHPLTRLPHDLFFGNAEAPAAAGRTALVLLTSVPVGFQGGTCALINREQRRQTRLEILRLLHRVFPDWRIVLKPHPDCGSQATVVGYFAEVGEFVTILPPEIPVEPLLESSGLVLDLPISLTTTLYTAVCAFPGKPAISANVDREFYGDYYRQHPEIDYVESMSELDALLRAIRGGSHRKAPPATADAGMRTFSTTNEAVHFLRAQSRPAATPL